MDITSILCEKNKTLMFASSCKDFLPNKVNVAFTNMA